MAGVVVVGGSAAGRTADGARFNWAGVGQGCSGVEVLVIQCAFQSDRFGVGGCPHGYVVPPCSGYLELLGQRAQQRRAINDPAHVDLVDQPGSDLGAHVWLVGRAVARPRFGRNQVVSRRAHEPRPAGVVGAGPALLEVPGITDVVEIATPPRRGRVERPPTGQFHPRNEHVNMNAVAALDGPVLYCRPAVGVGSKTCERETFEVAQYSADLRRGRSVAGVEGDDR